MMQYCLLDAAYTYLCRIDTLFYIELCFNVAFTMFFVILISGCLFFLLYLTIFFFVLHELTYLLYPKLLMLVNCLMLVNLEKVLMWVNLEKVN